MQNRLIPWVCGLLTIGLLLAFMHRDYPQVGLDFGQFVPRLIDTDLHIRINGPVPQWYTPSFGSGLPAFANPQHIQYSLIQLLLLVMGPWSAVLISTAVVSAVGFLTCYLFLRKTLEVSVTASTLGAMSVVANGFYIQHIAGGHVGFQLFPLIAVFLWASTSRRLTVLTASVLSGMTAAAIIHNGGPLIAVLIAGSLVITLQLVHLLRPSVVVASRVMKVGAVSVAIALALAGSKIYAVNAFMTHFPREISDRYEIGLAHALFGLGSQLAGGMVIIPMLLAGGFPTQRLDDALVRATGSGVHVSELDVSLQPVLTIALVLVVLRLLWLGYQRRVEWRAFSSVGLVLLSVSVWIALETTFARGLVYPALHQLPVFRSMHVNHRVAGVFILPLTVAGVLAIDAWRAHRRPAVGALMLITALACQSMYFFLPELFYRRWADLTVAERVHQRVRAGERFPIVRIDDLLEDHVFEANATSRMPYEPIFGYGNEHFKAETTEGPVETVRDGHFNLTNPASLVFPELNGLRTFERIREDDGENLRRFVNRKQPDWRHPAILDWLNALAVATLLFSVSALAYAGFTGRRTPRDASQV